MHKFETLRLNVQPYKQNEIGHPNRKFYKMPKKAISKYSVGCNTLIKMAGKYR